MKYSWWCVTAVVLALGCERDRASEASLPIDQYPASLDPSCRGGVARSYDECSDQREILAQARAKARQTGKSVLVIYGAEWCIWCHVLEGHLAGKYAAHDYAFERQGGEPYEWNMVEQTTPQTKEEALALNRYVASNFVLARIDGQHAPYGEEAVASTGVDTSSLYYYPYIFSVGEDGKVAKIMDAYTKVPGLELRESGGEEYRGLDRKVLLDELKVLRQAATR